MRFQEGCGVLKGFFDNFFEGHTVVKTCENTVVLEVVVVVVVGSSSSTTTNSHSTLWIQTLR